MISPSITPSITVWPLWLVLSLFTTAGLAALAAYIWRSRATEGGGSFLALVLGVGFWVLCSGLEHSFLEVETKLRFAQLAWLGIAVVPVAAFVVALQATGRGHWTRPRKLALLALPGAAMVALVFTNEHHLLVWTSVSLELDAPYPDLHLPHGPVFWATVVWHYALLVSAAGLLAAKYWREWPRNNQEAVLVALAMGAPWVANGYYLMNEAASPSLDFTPYAFSVTAICLSLALWRGHGVLNVIRVARSQILDELGDGALVVDARDRLIYANRAARDALGLPEVVAPIPIGPALEAHPDLLQALDGERADAHVHEISIHHSEGRCEGGWRTYDVRVTTLSNFQGVSTSRVLVMRDVTEPRRAESALRDSEVLLRKVIDLVPHMIFAKNRQGRFTLVNRTMAGAFGRPPELLLGQLPVPSEGRFREQFEQMHAEDMEVIDTGRPQAHPEAIWRFQDGEHRTFQVSKIPFTDPATGDASMLGIAIDVSERRASEEQMRQLAYHDGLTGLPNRQRFQTLLEHALASAERRQRRAALLFLDLDRFKQVNDRLGHARGDALLRSVANRLGDCVRLSDQIVRPGADEQQSTVSRLGGDEFTILLTEIGDPLDAAVVAMRILERLGETIEVDGHDLFTSASVGIAIYPDDAADADALFRHADQAMYDAKRRGRGRYAFFTPSMTEASERRHALEQGLRHALERSELALHYQPARHAKSGLLVGAEALLRWSHPELGVVPPREFLPVAEETGLIIPIGEWVLATACDQIRRWREQGLDLVPVSVNLSGFQLRQGGLLAFVTQLLEETETGPELLELEVTESTVMSGDDLTHATLERLKDIGMRFALDDFGTGYSSLSYLRRFPFDTVKIDRSFVRDIVTDTDGRVLTQGVIDLAHGLGLRVVAEGVETVAELECLREADCDVIQGHLLSPPLPPDEFTRYLQADKHAQSED